jgi:ribosomal protein L11 methyltransferase
VTDGWGKRHGDSALRAVTDGRSNGSNRTVDGMEWLEVSVEVDHETAEAVAEVLSRYAHRGVVIEGGPDGWQTGPVMVRGYLPADDELWSQKKRIEEGLWHLGQIRPIPDPSFRPVAEQDWAETWKKRLEVLRIGERLVIRPSWLDYDAKPADVVVQLDPGMAFGTGLHPTTQLCLCALERFVQPGMQVLDLGTGSGILAVAAVKLGAGRVLALDSDQQAVKVARANVVDNDVAGRVSVRRGSLADVSGTFDLVVVNILARVIVEMVEEGLSERLRPDGILVTAGIIAETADSVAMAFERGNFRLVERRQRGDWVSLLAERT